MDNSSIDVTSTRIGFVLIDGFALMSYAAAIEPLRAANLLAGRNLYRIDQIPADGMSARSSSGAEIAASAMIGDTARFDLVLLFAGGDPMSYRNPRLDAWLRRLDRTGTSLGGISGGPVILANAGLMHRRRLTLHWEHIPALAEKFSSLMIERAIFVVDRNRVTCAGGSAPLDLMHMILTRDHGPEFARAVSDWFMHTEIRPAAAPQRATLMERYGTSSPPLLSAIEAMLTHLSDPLGLKQISVFSGVGVRQLSRLFNDTFDMSPMGFYRKLRLESALNLMRNSAAPLVDIALATGFSDRAHFSTAFSAAYGTPPGRLRKTMHTATPDA